MATSPSAVSGLPEGYSLEGQQPTTPAAPQQTSGLPEGYTLETGDTSQASSQNITQDAYKKATASGPFAPAGAAEKAMGQVIGDNKAQAKEGLLNLAKAAGYTATAAIPGVSEVAPEAGEVINAAGEPIGEGAKSVMSHIASTYGTTAVEAIKDAAAAHPIVAKLLMYGMETAGSWKVAKYMNLFGGSK